MEALKLFLIFFKKDILLEFRRKEFLISSVSLSVFIGVLIGFSFANAFINHELIERIFPTLFWLGAFFISILSIGRSYAYEERLNAPVAFQNEKNLVQAFFLAKVVSAILIVTFANIIFLLTLSALLNITTLNFALFGLLIALYSIGFCSIGILLSALTSSSQSSVTLFSLIILPLLFPLFFSVSELTHILIHASHVEAFSMIIASPWLTMLALIDGIYIFTTSILFPSVIKE
jgi:heme exporter protein B